MSLLKKIVDSYMQKVQGIREYCERCLRTEGYGGNVVLMIVDAAFTSIGLKLLYSSSAQSRRIQQKIRKNRKNKKFKGPCKR